MTRVRTGKTLIWGWCSFWVYLFEPKQKNLSISPLAYAGAENPQKRVTSYTLGSKKLHQGSKLPQKATPKATPGMDGVR